ncbi:hypothetical protein ABK040_001858 [Willaertia magna]
MRSDRKHTLHRINPYPVDAIHQHQPDSSSYVDDDNNNSRNTPSAFQKFFKYISNLFTTSWLAKQSRDNYNSSTDENITEEEEVIPTSTNNNNNQRNEQLQNLSLEGKINVNDIQFDKFYPEITNEEIEKIKSSPTISKIIQDGIQYRKLQTQQSMITNPDFSTNATTHTNQNIDSILIDDDDEIQLIEEDKQQQKNNILPTDLVKNRLGGKSLENSKQPQKKQTTGNKAPNSAFDLHTSSLFNNDIPHPTPIKALKFPSYPETSFNSTSQREHKSPFMPKGYHTISTNRFKEVNPSTKRNHESFEVPNNTSFHHNEEPISDNKPIKRMKTHFRHSISQSLPKTYSETAKRILETLDQLSSPLIDVEKVPQKPLAVRLSTIKRAQNRLKQQKPQKQQKETSSIIEPIEVDEEIIPTSNIDLPTSFSKVPTKKTQQEEVQPRKQKSTKITRRSQRGNQDTPYSRPAKKAEQQQEEEEEEEEEETFEEVMREKNEKLSKIPPATLSTTISFAPAPSEPKETKEVVNNVPTTSFSKPVLTTEPVIVQPTSFTFDKKETKPLFAFEKKQDEKKEEIKEDKIEAEETKEEPKKETPPFKSAFTGFTFEKKQEEKKEEQKEEKQEEKKEEPKPFTFTINKAFTSIPEKKEEPKQVETTTEQDDSSSIASLEEEEEEKESPKEEKPEEKKEETQEEKKEETTGGFKFSSIPSGTFSFSKPTTETNPLSGFSFKPSTTTTTTTETTTTPSFSFKATSVTNEAENKPIASSFSFEKKEEPIKPLNGFTFDKKEEEKKEDKPTSSGFAFKATTTPITPIIEEPKNEEKPTIGMSAFGFSFGKKEEKKVEEKKEETKEESSTTTGGFKFGGASFTTPSSGFSFGGAPSSLSFTKEPSKIDEEAETKKKRKDVPTEEEETTKKPAFGFGGSIAPKEDEKKDTVNAGFAFGGNSGFSFTKPNPQEDKKEETKPAFAFGATTTTSPVQEEKKEETKSGFTFANNLSSNPFASFGKPVATTEQEKPVTTAPTTNVFTFGGATTPSSTTTPAPSFSFKVDTSGNPFSNNNNAPPSTSFGFGGSNPSFSFGATAAPSGMMDQDMNTSLNVQSNGFGAGNNAMSFGQPSFGMQSQPFGFGGVPQQNPSPNSNNPFNATPNNNPFSATGGPTNMQSATGRKQIKAKRRH